MFATEALVPPKGVEPSLLFRARLKRPEHSVSATAGLLPVVIKKKHRELECPRCELNAQPTV